MASINGLQITNISIYPISKSKGTLRAVAKIILNDAIHLTNMRVYDGENGLFVSYPVEFSSNGEDFRQVYYPIRKEVREHIEGEILEEYTKTMEKVA
jgi:stage V sporulation protein G